MKHLLLISLICLSILQGYSAPANRDNSMVYDQNEIPMTINSAAPLSNSEIKAESITQEKNIALSEESEESTPWYNIIGVIIGLLSSLFSTCSLYTSAKVSKRNNQLSNEVKKLEIKMRTSDLIVSKRLEVFPKLHILTDTLGAAIRYYQNHISDQEKKEWNTIVLKREIKVFHQKISSWDANYCIFGGRILTDKIGYVRHELLEKQDDWGKKEITPDDIEVLYNGLQDIEQELKREMKIHFTDEPKDEAEHIV